MADATTKTTETTETTAPQTANERVPGNNLDGTAHFTLGGKRRTLRYTLYALERIEEETGKSPTELFGEIRKERKEGRAANIATIGLLLWGGLVSDDEDLTPKDVKKMVDIAELPTAVAAMTAAFSRSNTGADPVEEDGVAEDGNPSDGTEGNE